MSEEAKNIVSLSTQFSDNAIAALKTQRHQLEAFVKSQLRSDIDFGIIPGSKKPSLYKPGAEKLCKLYQLGMRFVSDSNTIDLEKNFAMFTYRVEVFHIPTGKVISQCEGSTNSQEKKYRSQDMASIVNTLQKMAQKRAYVGAVILAVGASDFFTQDLEDMDLPKDGQNPNTPPIDGDSMGEYVVGFSKKYKGQKLKDIDLDELKGFVNWLFAENKRENDKKNENEKKPIGNHVTELVSAIKAYEEELRMGHDVK